MNFCSNCGNKFNDTDKYCSGCGTSRNFGNFTSNESTQLTPKSQNNSVELILNKQSIATDTQDVFVEITQLVNGDYKYGFLNLKNNFEIKPIYDSIGEYDSSGYCVVEINGKYGCINQKGEWVIQPKFDCIHPFTETGYSTVNLNDKWGVINRRGEWIIQPQFENLCDFKNGFCAATIGGISDKSGFIDINGDWIIQPKFDGISSDGFTNPYFCCVYIGDKRGVINSKGDWIIKPMNTRITVQNYVENNTCLVWLTDLGKMGLININGEWIIQPIFERVGTFDSLGYCIVEMNQKYGFMDRHGEWIIQPQFESLEEYDDKEYCEAELNGKYGFINRDGNWIIQPTFESLGEFDEQDYCKAKLNGKYGFVNRQGNWIIQPTFESLVGFDEQNYCKAELNGKYGFINRDGNWMIQPIYLNLEHFHRSDYCGASIDSNWGFINRKGDWIIQPIYSTVSYFLDKHFIAGVGDKYILGSFQENWISEQIYDDIEQIEGSFSFKVVQKNKFGFIDENGNWIKNLIYDYENKGYVWNEITNEWEREHEKIIKEFDFNKYFESVDSKVYISENIPPKKLNAFVNRIKKEFQDENKIGNEVPKVYCDDTIFGKGDDGFLITMDEEDDEDLRLFLAPSSGYLCWFYFSLIDKIEVNKNNLIITTNVDTFSFTFIGKEKAIQQVKSFFEEYFYIEMEDNEDDEDVNEDEEDYNDNPLGLREGGKENDDNDPLGLRS
jgi:hypothetical protein